MKKILLFGKNGQVGWELQRSLASLGEVIALDRSSTDFRGNLAELISLKETILTIAPDIIVNAAAYTAVDKAESEPDIAQLINADAPHVIALAAKEIGALLIHYSTDYVFSGSGDWFWREEDNVEPQNIYGASKLAGEKAIISSGCKYLIFRTSWVYGFHGRNFIKTMLSLAKTKDNLSVINDQHGAPTGAELIADVSAFCIRQFTPQKAGVYHLAASGTTTWYDYAKYILDLAVIKNEGLLLSSASVQPIRSAEYKVAAKRPLNSRLNCAKLYKEFAICMPPWQQGVKRVLAELLEI